MIKYPVGQRSDVTNKIPGGIQPFKLFMKEKLQRKYDRSQFPLKSTILVPYFWNSRSSTVLVEAPTTELRGGLELGLWLVEWVRAQRFPRPASSQGISRATACEVDALFGLYFGEIFQNDFQRPTALKCNYGLAWTQRITRSVVISSKIINVKIYNNSSTLP